MDANILSAERAEQAMWSSMWQATDPDTRERLGASCSQYLDADCISMSAIPQWFFNRVIGLGLEQEVTPEDIDHLVAHYRDQGLPVGIALCPETRTQGIDGWLEQRGFSIANHWVKMVRNTAAPREIDCDLDIRLASAEHEQAVADVTARGFGLPEMLKPMFGAAIHAKGNRVYVAWDGETPAAVGSLTLVDGVGHLNTAATLPEYRGRGAQGAIMARRIRDGIELGCENFVTETWQPGDEPNHSYNNMLRHGFELAYARPNWVLATDQAE